VQKCTVFLYRERENIKKKIIRNLLVALVAIGGYAGLAYILDIGCTFKRFLGIPCPGCGMTRAFLAFFKGDIAQAFFFHPLFPLVPLLILVVSIRGGKITQSHKVDAAIYILVGVAFIATYAIRMYCLFPSVPPMDYTPPFYR